MKPPRPRVPESVAVLRPLVDAGVLDAGEVAVADAVARLDPDGADPAVVQGVAIAALARRLGHTCVDLVAAPALCAGAVAGGEDDLPSADFDLPPTDEWIAALQASDLVATTAGDGASDRPLVLDAGLGRLWLARYAYYEQVVGERLTALTASAAAFADDASLEAAVTAAFGGTDGGAQRAAVVSALQRRVTFVTGGPGTGKTWTVGRLLDAVETLGADGTRRSVALAAPTGKAAERLTEAVGQRVHATTLHRLLGVYPGSDLGVDAPRKLTEDLVVVDEASMIDLTMMTRLVGALAPHAHVVFVGDPDQLLSVEVGSVLRDVVDAAADPGSPLHGTVVELEQTHRFGGDLGALAGAVRTGDADGVLGLLDDAAHAAVSTVDPGSSTAVEAIVADLVAAAATMVEAARDGRAADALAAARAVKVLTATRSGPFGLGWWNDRLGRALGFARGEWKPGRPLIVTRNDPVNGVFNGDTGIVVPDPDGTGVVVALAGPDGPRLMPPSRLRHTEDWWAMTVHKSQGSEFDRVVVSLPTRTVPILSRELLYTAVTRARSDVTVLGGRTVVRTAVERRVERASGLRDRLGGGRTT